MAIVKKNTYEIGVNNDLTNVVNNVDYNRLGTDLTQVGWNGSAMVVEAGSIIECNGSLYAVETSDEAITGNGYVAFNPATLAFYTTTTTPTWDATRQGYYISSTHRVTKWSVIGELSYVGEQRLLKTSVQYLLSKDFNKTTLIDTGANGILFDITQNGEQFVAVGPSNSVMTSPDGITWTSNATGVAGQSFSGIDYSGSLYCAVLSTTTGIYTSSDGYTWSDNTPGGLAVGLFDVDWSGSLFVAVGSSGNIWTSPDGSTWTSRTSGTANILRGVEYSGDLSLYCAVGASGDIITSPDAITWTSRTSGTSTQLREIKWADSISSFVVVGDSGEILTSTDGITWTAQESDVSEDLYGVAAYGDIVCAVGASGTLLVSVDGIVWVSRFSGSNNNIWAIGNMTEIFCAVGSYGSGGQEGIAILNLSELSV